MIGYRFSEYVPVENGKTTVDKLLDIFLHINVHTSGDVREALNWMTQLDRRHKLITDVYGMGDFIDDLKDKGYLRENEQGETALTGKSEQTIRKKSLEGR